MNDVNISGCRFSADIVPYMYGELSGAESFAFESHLLECGSCTDEFAVVSNARYEVYDWKKLEFDPLPTPRFSIPYADDVVATGVVEWFGKLRAAFGQSWLIPTASFAGFAIVAVLGATFLLSGDGKPVDIARTNSNTPPATVAIPTGTVGGESVDKTVAPIRVEPVPVPVRASSRNREARKHFVRTPKPVTPKATEARIVNGTVPRLNEFNDDEDTSLRLAQLFDDVDTRR